MRTRTRSYAPKVKRPTLWTGAANPSRALDSNPIPNLGGVHFICSMPFAYTNVAGWPNLIDATLQRSLMDFTAFWDGTGGTMFAAYGLQVATLNSAGSVDAALPLPLSFPDNDWIFHGFLLGPQAPLSYTLGAQVGSSGSRVESAARRKLKDDEVLVLSVQNGLSGQYDSVELEFAFGMRCLWKGR